MTARLQYFLDRYRQSTGAAAALKELRRKHRAIRYPKTARVASPVGASKEEIAAWAKALVARREAKKKRKK